MTVLRIFTVALLAVSLLSGCESNSRYSSSRDNMVQRAMLGGVIGAGLGAGVGAATGGTALSGAGYGAGAGMLIGILSE